MSTLGRRIKKLRKKKELTQKEVAKELGWSESTVANYESGSRKPDYEKLNKLADFFNVTVDYLTGRVDYEESKSSRVEEALEGNPELLEFFEELTQRQDLQLLFKQTRNFSDESIRFIMNFMKNVEEDHKKGGE